MLLYTRVAPPKVPKRRSRAGCTYCKCKKKKCSESRPKCDRCEEHGQDCVYEPIKPRQRRRHYYVDGTSPSSKLSSPRHHVVDPAIHFNARASHYGAREMSMWDLDSAQFSGVFTIDRSRREPAPLLIRGSDSAIGDYPYTQNTHEIVSPLRPDIPDPASHENEVANDDVEEICRSDLTASFDSSKSTSLATTSTTSPSSMASPLIEFHPPAFAEFSEEDNRRNLLDHFANVLSHLIVLREDQGNPFQQLVLPLAHQNTTVMNAIYALSSAHLEYRGVQSSEKSFLFHSQAIEGLSRLIKSGSEWNKNELLAAIMLLVYCEVLVQPCRPSIVHGHLKGAMAIMENNMTTHHATNNPTGLFLERVGLRILNFLLKLVDDLVANECEHTTAWLKQAFRFYDVITALSYGTAPISQAPDESGFALFPPIDCRGATAPAGNADTLLGMATSLWPIIHRLSMLGGLKNEVMQAELAGDGCKALMLQAEFDSAAASIELALQQWQPAQKPGDGLTGDEGESRDRDEATARRRMNSMVNNALAYRHSGFVYLYRTIHGRPRNDGAIQFHARKSLVHCLGTVKSRGPMGALLWPLFVAACEAMDSHDRRLANEAFAGIGRRQGMANIDRAWWIVQEVWRRADMSKDGCGQQDTMHMGDLWRVVSADMGLSVVFG